MSFINSEPPAWNLAISFQEFQVEIQILEVLQ